MLNRSRSCQVPAWEDPGESSFSVPSLAQGQLEVLLCVPDLSIWTLCVYLTSCLDYLQQNLRHKSHPFTSLCCTSVSPRGAALNNTELFMTACSLPVCSAQLYQCWGGSGPHRADFPKQSVSRKPNAHSRRILARVRLLRKPAEQEFVCSQGLWVLSEDKAWYSWYLCVSHTGFV